MFGAIVASRPVVTDLQAISETQFAFNIPSQPPFSHIVVFLLPGNTLAPGTAAAVYIQLPPSSEFRLLGAIANDKQSAIFRVNNPSGNGQAANPLPGDDVMIDDATAQPIGIGQEPGGPNIVVGISVENAANIQAQLAALAPNSSSSTQQPGSAAPASNIASQQPAVSTKVLAQRIISNAFNYLSSFATGSSGSEVVPLKSFQDWWSKFEKKLELDPTFLGREEQA